MYNKHSETSLFRERGFSLVEILVVILVIGILASIAIPVFLNHRKSAYDAALKDDVRSIALAYQTRVANGKSNDDFVSEAGDKDRVIVIAGDRYAEQNPLSTPGDYEKVDYKKVKGLEDLKVSPGTNAELIVKNDSTIPWKERIAATPENQFCIVANNSHSNYNTVTMENKYIQYNGWMFYSSMQGGITTMQKLHDEGMVSKNDNTDPCFQHVLLWERFIPNKAPATK